MLLSIALNMIFVFVMNLTNRVTRYMTCKGMIETFFFLISFGASNSRRRVPTECVWCLVLVHKISDYFYSLNALSNTYYL